MKPTDFAYHLSKFLTEYLPGRRNLSVNTIKSYRDTFMLLLLYLQQEKSVPPEKVSLKIIESSTIDDFLKWLGNARKNSISTQNQRLAAIHAFFRFIQSECPEMIFQAQKILGIDFKRSPKPVIGYISENTLSEILRLPDISNPMGRRDLVLLSVLYDTGARVSELCDLTVCDIRLEKPVVIKLTGKGNKTRFVPLMAQTAELLKGYLSEQNLFTDTKPSHPVFFNKQYNKLTRAGVTYILNKYVNSKRLAITGTKVTPHVLRHTKAMHLLQADVNLVYIRDLLGHSQISTTEIYVRADTEMKRKALEKSANGVIPSPNLDWEKDKGLMNWLAELCK